MPPIMRVSLGNKRQKGASQADNIVLCICGVFRFLIFLFVTKKMSDIASLFAFITLTTYNQMQDNLEIPTELVQLVLASD